MKLELISIERTVVPKHLFLVGGLFLLTAVFILTRRTNTVAHGDRPAVNERVEELRQHRFDAWLSQIRVLQESKSESAPPVSESAPPVSESALRNKGTYMTVGILVAMRESPTIYYLLENLLREPRMAKNFIIIVHVAYSASRDEELLGYLRRLKDIVVTIVEEKPYPEAMEENINDTRGDSMERTVWRTTHGEA